MGMQDSRIVVADSPFNPDQRHCIVCEKKLTPDRLAWCSEECFDNLRKMLRTTKAPPS